MADGTLAAALEPMYPGDRLDYYRVESVISHTGMATLLRATDVRTGAIVVLKVPDPIMESDVAYFERFQREQEIGKHLEHPGVIHTIHEDNHSRDYLVMEWVEGRPLRKILNEQKKIPVERALKLIRGLLDVLEYIHGQGVVHRDLKPENVLLDDEDHIKLIDFGIALRRGARRLTFGNLSRIMGTPDYISPEQIKRKRGDARSDLYSLGVMLYEMLTGEVPFRGDDPLAVMNDRLLNPPIPPREIDPSISPQLQEIIYRALERDRKNRYARAREFAWDLDHMDQVGVADRAELQDWRRRRSRSATGTLVYVGLALIPVFFALLLYATHHR